MGGTTGEEQQWLARPWAARSVKTLAFLLPLAASLGATIAVTSVVPPPEALVGRIAWWIALSVLATLVLVAVDRISRRLLPLSALFGLSLVFPDEAPSRFRTAIRSGTVRQLEKRIEQARADGLGHDEGEAARRLVELAGALSIHDRLTRGHSERVRAYTKLIATELHLDEREADRLQWAGLAHDVGKLFVDPDILNKPGSLTDDEYDAIKRHAAIGAELVEPLRGWLGDALDGVGQHHERWDGRGYPAGLSGEDISLAGRIVAVADVFDVITSVRSYKKAGAVTAAREELVRCSGSQFDPKVVRAFLNIGLGRLRMIVGPLSWIAQLPVAGRVPLGAAAGTLAGSLAAAFALVIGGVAGVDDPVDVIAAPVPRAAGELPTAPVELDEPTPAAFASPSVDDSTITPGLPPPVSPPSAPPSADQPVEPPLAPVLPPPPPPPPPVPPSAVDDTATVAEDGSIDIDVLANDGPGDGGPVRIQTVVDPIGATASLVGESIRFTPDPDVNGPLSFGYTIADDAGSEASATVVVSVTPVNDPPSFTSGPDQQVSEDAGAVAVPAWIVSSSGGPADEEQAVTYDVSVAVPGLFAAAPALDPSGTLTFTPAPDANGSTTVDVEAVDSEGLRGGVQTFTVDVDPVNDVPVATGESFRTDRGVSLSVPGPGLLANDSDIDHDALTVRSVPVVGPANGTLALAGDGGFVYTPDVLFEGLDTFTYEIDDGAGGTATAAVEVFVDSTLVPQGLYLGAGFPGADRWPLLSAPPPLVGPEPDHDLDGAPGLTLQDSGQDLDETDPSQYQHWTIAPSSPLALRGPVTVDLWSSVAGFDAVSDLDYSAWLLDCALDGSDCQVIASTVDVHVDEWNREVTGWVLRTLNVGSADHVVLPGRSLELRLMFDHEDAWLAMSGARPSRLEITLGDATPVANADTAAMLEDGAPVVIDVLDNDVDSDLDPTSVSVLSGPSAGSAVPQPSGAVEYAPDPDVNGTDSFVYEVCDVGGTCATATVSISITPVNDAPTFVIGPDIVVPMDSGSQRFDVWASAILAGPLDESGQDLIFDVTTDAAPSFFKDAPTIDEDGDLRFEVEDGVSGLVTVTVVLRDDGGTASGGADASTAIVFTIEVLAP